MGKRPGSSDTKKEFSLDRMMHAQSILDFGIKELMLILGCFGLRGINPQQCSDGEKPILINNSLQILLVDQAISKARRRGVETLNNFQ